MMDYLKSLFRTPEALSLAATELEDAKRKLLDAQTSLEYAQAMVKFREAQINRLSKYLKDIGNETH